MFDSTRIPLKNSQALNLPEKEHTFRVKPFISKMPLAVTNHSKFLPHKLGHVTSWISVNKGTLGNAILKSTLFYRLHKQCGAYNWFWLSATNDRQGKPLSWEEGTRLNSRVPKRSLSYGNWQFYLAGGQLFAQMCYSYFPVLPGAKQAPFRNKHRSLAMLFSLQCHKFILHQIFRLSDPQPLLVSSEV